MKGNNHGARSTRLSLGRGVSAMSSIARNHAPTGMKLARCRRPSLGSSLGSSLGLNLECCPKSRIEGGGFADKITIIAKGEVCALGIAGICQVHDPDISLPVVVNSQ
jgi:hypothetical protein